MPPPRSLQNLRPGDSVAGRFRIVDEIGSGGFSVVFRAYQKTMQRYVALKILKPSISNDDNVIERFRREALFASHLSHPNTITLFDYGRTETGLCYIAMELLEGTELGEVIRGRGEEGLGAERVWNVLAQSAQSLAEAHRMGLIHRDLKPENIYLVEQDDDELVKVLDFGLSKAFGTIVGGDSGAMTPLTQEGKVFGTPLYMAPEQAMDKPISPSIDVYAMGHIAYSMFTGAPRYGDMSTAMDIMLRQIYDPPLSLPEPYDETPFADLVEACTLKDPDERISDGEELYEALTDPTFADYMPAGPHRERLSERGAAHRNWTAGLGSESSVVDDPESLSFDRELGRLREVFGEVCDCGCLRLVLINGPKGGGRTQLLHRFLADLEGGDEATLVHRQTYRSGAHEDRGLTADIAQLQQREDDSSLGEGILPMLDADGEAAAGTPGSIAQSDTAFFGDLHGKRETMLSKTGRLFRERASERPVVWALERLERLDAFTLAFLNWFFQDLQSRPAPVFIIATVSRPDLVERTGLLRYTQAILGAAEPTVRRLFVAQTNSETPAMQPEVEDISETLTGNQMAVPDEIAGADETEDSERRGTLQGGVGAVDDESPDLQELFDQTLGLLAQLGDEVGVETWREVRDDLLDGSDAKNIEFILERAEQFGIVDREEGVLRFGSPSFAERLRDRIDEVDAFDADTRRALARALAEPPSEASPDEIDLAVHHLTQADDLTAAIQLLNDAGNEAFSILDLDAAREYYMQLQRLFEQTDDERLAEVRDDIEAAPSRIWLRIGEIRGALDEHGAAEDALERAAERAEGESPRIRGRALKRVADIQFAQERFPEAERQYGRAGEAFREAARPASAAAANSLVGDSLLHQGRFEEAHEVLSEVLEDADSLDLPLVVARTQLRIGRASLRLGRFDEAFRHLARSSEGFDALDQPSEAMEARMVFGEAAFAARDFALARDNFEYARGHAASVRRFDDDFPTLGLARSLAALQEYERAADRIDEEGPDARVQSPVRKARWAQHRADLFFVHGAYPAAVDRYDDMQRRARSVGRTGLVLSALLRKAFLHFHDIEYDRSAEVFEEAAEMAREYGSHQRYIVARASAVYLESASRGFPEKNERLAEQLDKATGNSLAWATAVCTQFIADVRAANGRWQAAEELLGRARERASESGRIGMLAPIGHRLQRIRALRDGTEPPELEGSWIGGPLPPEIRVLRADAIYVSE